MLHFTVFLINTFVQIDSICNFDVWTWRLG